MARFGSASRPLRLFLLAACVAGLSTAVPARAAAPGERPGIFLEGASVPRAKGLALDAALIKGWHVAVTERNHVIFETILEEPASVGPPNAVAPDYTLLRIRADFIQTPAGVNAYLYAEEIWYAGSSKEWSADVTPQYRSNLTNALSSLQSQWAKSVRGGPSLAPTGPPSDTTIEPSASDPAMATTQPKIRVAPIEPAVDTAASPVIPTSPSPELPPPSPPRQEDAPAVVAVEVGTWAYHAEEFALASGCVLDEIGAELIAGDGASELHRVHCQNGTSVLVRCDRETCVNAR